MTAISGSTDMKLPARQKASFTKAFFSWGDSYRIDIAGGENEVLVLATVLAIDCVIEDSSSSH